MSSRTSVTCALQVCTSEKMDWLLMQQLWTRFAKWSLQYCKTVNSMPVVVGVRTQYQSLLVSTLGRSLSVIWMAVLKIQGRHGAWRRNCLTGMSGICYPVWQFYTSYKHNRLGCTFDRASCVSNVQYVGSLTSGLCGWRKFYIKTWNAVIYFLKTIWFLRQSAVCIFLCFVVICWYVLGFSQYLSTHA